MRIAVAGASGLIGQALLNELENAGHETVVFSRPGAAAHSRPTIAWDPSRGTISESDLAQVGSLDVVVNLAGAGIGDRRWSAKRKALILDSRIKSTELLVSTLEKVHGRATHLINASAIGYYGDRGNEELTENSHHGEGFLADVCVAWESAAQSETVPVTFVRTGIVMTKNGGALAKQLPLFKLGLGGSLGTGRQWLSPISLEDEVRALMHIIDQGLTGPINLSAPTPVTNSEFTKALAKIVRRPAIFRAPQFALKLALGEEMASELLLISQRVLPARLLESGFTFNHPELEPLLEWATRN
jgi:uncharacterized protein (TIGR01777 family)